MRSLSPVQVSQAKRTGNAQFSPFGTGSSNEQSYDGNESKAARKRKRIIRRGFHQGDE